MPRNAQDVLEFDSLRELLRRRTTCSLGGRAIDALPFSEDRGRLQAVFRLIREAREWLRQGREMGFGALADAQGWLGRLEAPGAVLEPRELLDAAAAPREREPAAVRAVRSRVSAAAAACGAPLRDRAARGGRDRVRDLVAAIRDGALRRDRVDHTIHDFADPIISCVRDIDRTGRVDCDPGRRV